MAISDIMLDRNLPATVCTQLCDQIRGRIASGELAVGTQIPNARQWCKTLGVAYPTLSRSLKLLVREGLLVRIPSSGTFVKASPTAVKNIAIAYDSTVHSEHEPWLEPVLRGIHRASEARRWQLQLFPLKDAAIFGQGYETLLSRLLRNHDLGGVVACSPHSVDDICQIKRLEIPVVTYRNQYLKTGTPCVMEDVDAGARYLVEHVVHEMGHRRIKLVMGSQPLSSPTLLRSSAKLAEALLEQLSRRGIVLNAGDVMYSEFRWATAAATVRRWLRSADRPTCILCCSDSLAIEVMALATELNLRVPQDLSVASYGDVRRDVSLTSVHVPLEEMGAALMDRLDETIAHRAAEVTCLPVTIRVRRSTAHRPDVA